jgi:hypothetical protein
MILNFLPFRRPDRLVPTYYVGIGRGQPAEKAREATEGLLIPLDKLFRC